ncbi:calaxin [Genypterus blacodes]|uniref:calaxin n=1 Tax=Genypterus blacodes TaxID=154954 RepID=UPI003F77570F
MAGISAMNRKKMQAQAKSISKQVKHFSKTEAECLIRHFTGLLVEQTGPGKAAGGGLDRGRFRAVLHGTFGITDDVILDAVFKTFDKENDGLVTVEEWIEGLSVLLRGTLEEKIKYCFQVYDLNGDEYVSREEMLRLFKDCFLKLPLEDGPEEAVRDVVELTLKMMDHDKDGRLSYEDFEKAVTRENLLLEAFGTCLPDAMRIQTFERQTFQDPL